MAGVLAATVAVAASMAPARAATPAAWRLAYRFHAPGAMTAVAATSPANAWAAGFLQQGPDLQIVNQLFVVHWDGRRWRPVTVPGGNGFIPNFVVASSARNVWIFAESDRQPHNEAVFRYDGSRWHEMAVPDGAGGSPVGNLGVPTPVVLSSSDVWTAADQPGCSLGSALGCVTEMWHWNGRTWKSYPLPVNIGGVAALSPTDVLAVGLGGQKVAGGPGTVVAYRWNGRRWATARVPHPRVYYYASIGLDSASDVWIAAGSPGPGIAVDSFAIHWNGRRWSTTPPFFTAQTPVVPDGRGGVWLGGLAHWNGRSWTDVGMAPPWGGSIYTLVKIPGTSGSFWSADQLGANGSTGDPGITVYGPLP
jgi:hypothetical protein